MADEIFTIDVLLDAKDQTGPGVSSASQKLNGFDKSVQKVQQRLNKMNRSKYQIVMNALDRASNVISKVGSKIKTIAEKTFRFTLKTVDIATAPLKGVLRLLTSVQGAVLGTAGAFAGIVQPMNVAGDYEQTQVAFTTMLGSAEKANEFLEKASDFANRTPFEFPELIDSSKLMLAFGFQAENVLEMMSTIGDTASGLGAGSEGIERITRALGQMQAKGRAQAEELLQLQELGVPAAQILQDELGLTAEQVGNIGKESIAAQPVIEALLRGMDKRFGGMMANQSKTAKGMISTIKDTLQNKLLRNWGTGLWEGFKPGLEKITGWIDENQDTLSGWAEAWKKAGANISKSVMTKVESLGTSIKDLVNSPEWKNAQTFGDKIGIAWDKLIAEPFNEWWSGTGKAWFAEKAGEIGQGIGGGITTGLLTILGIDLGGSEKDGKSVGGSFLNGFLKGFDTSEILTALTGWVGNHKGLAAGLGVMLGDKLIKGISSGMRKLQKVKGLFDGLRGKGKDFGKFGFPSGLNGIDAISTMTVTARVVNLYGQGAGPGSNDGKAGNFPKAAASAGSGKAAKTTLRNGVTLAGTGGALKTGLATVGTSLGSGASTLTGAAVAGGASLTGGLLGAAGIGSGIYDIYQGTQKQGKEAKDNYFQGGTKIGMVGAGAAAGAAIGSIVPVLGTGVGALVGAGVGGVGALLGGDSVGKALSDSTDEGGALRNFWDGVKTKAGEAKDFIAEKWGDFSSWFNGNVWTPAKDEAISNINMVAGAWELSKQAISEQWSPFASWFSETVWTPVQGAAQTVGSWIGERFDEAGEHIQSGWAGLSGWFGETVWEPVKSASQTAGGWIGDQFTHAKDGIQSAWASVSGWFSENVWEPIKGAATSAWSWVTDKWNAAKAGAGALSEMGSKATGLTTSSGSGSVMKHAWGGILNTPHMGLVAEDGPESIIPLNPSRRSRGIDLWKQTGQKLGIQPYENGGIIGNSNDAPIPVNASEPQIGGNPGGIAVQVDMKPEFIIQGGSSEEIMERIRSCMRELADEFGDTIARNVEMALSNIPMKGTVS